MAAIWQTTYMQIVVFLFKFYLLETGVTQLAQLGQVLKETSHIVDIMVPDALFTKKHRWYLRYFPVVDLANCFACWQN